MCSRYLGFILLVWFPGALHAQSAAQPCPAPSLDGGYFVPVKETYSHDFKLTYACRNTHKPAVQGWWAESVCQNGTWSHTPRCIDENACFPPTIANAKYTEASEGWYEQGHIIRITCDKGYEHKDNMATARCRDGTWSSLPSCEISIKSCRVPPKDPHAVIIDQGYQEMFPKDAGVKYECEDGYSIEGSHNYKLFCLAGTWTEGPMCSNETGRGGGHGGSAEAGTGGGHSTSSGRGTQPGSGGSSSTSANRPLFISIEHCGTRPIIPNGVVVEEERMYLKFQCQAFYKQVGSDTLRCHNDGSWSKVPVCEDAFCVLEPGYYVPGLEVSVAMYIKEGETKYIPCTRQDHSVAVHCSNRRITHTGCKETGRGGGHGGSADAGKSGGNSTSSGRGTQPVGGGGGGSRPDIGHGGSVEVGPGGGHSTSSGRGTQPGSGVEHCGTRPIVPNGVVVEEGRMYLKFQCQAFYKQVGSDIVRCHNDGSWSKVPVCEEAFCVLEPGYYWSALKVSVAMYINEGQTEYIPCGTWRDYSVAVHCSNRRITHSRQCCHRYDHDRGACN